MDSSKIRQELGWEPPFTMEEGLGETAGWFKRPFWVLSSELESKGSLKDSYEFWVLNSELEKPDIPRTVPALRINNF